MPADRHHVAGWLLRRGFRELKVGSGHRYFEKDGVKITIPGHGRRDLPKHIMNQIARTMERHFGLTRQEVREELL